MQRYRLTKGENLHLAKNGSILCVRYTKGGKVFQREITSGEGVSEAVQIGDEMDYLFNGERIIRVGNNIYIK